MRSLLLFTVILFIHIQTVSQELTVFKGEEQLSVNRLDDQFWHVVMDEEEYYLLQRTAVETLAKRVDSLRAVVEHRDSIIAAQERLLTAYEEFEKRADEHIEVQNQIITTADSLFHGYRSLYNDLKELIATPTFAFTGGLGVVYLEDDVWRPVGMVGLQYHHWQAQYQIGRRYHGVVVGFRLPVLF